MASSPSVFSRRFKEARKRAGMTQEQVAVRAGIDEFSASARVSQYETGKHVPSYGIARNLAKAMKVPVEFLYTADDRTAELLLCWFTLNLSQRTALLTDIRSRLAAGD